jgi:hypothetical protein
VRDFTEECGLGEDTPPDLLEVSSFYRCERGQQPVCIAKQLWDGDWDHPTGLGCFYYLLTRVMFTGEGSEGKVMGLAPFGRATPFDLPELVVDGHEVSIPASGWSLFGQKERFSHFLDGPGTFEDAADLAAAGQRAFETALLRVTAWLHEQTGERNVVFAGGTALNCSANGRILRESAFDDVFIPPSAHDGGTALGCALYGMIECLGRESGFRWTDDFLGPDTDPDALAAAVRTAQDDPTLDVERPADLAARTAELLAAGCVVAVHQDRSESGPRALGHRSILGDARTPRCATSSTSGSRAASGSARSPRSCWPSARRSSSTSTARPASCSSPSTSARSTAGAAGDHPRRRHRAHPDRRAGQHAVPARAALRVRRRHRLPGAAQHLAQRQGRPADREPGRLAGRAGQHRDARARAGRAPGRQAGRAARPHDWEP